MNQASLLNWVALVRMIWLLPINSVLRLGSRSREISKYKFFASSYSSSFFYFFLFCSIFSSPLMFFVIIMIKIWIVFDFVCLWEMVKFPFGASYYCGGSCD